MPDTYYWRARSWRERLLSWPWTPWYSLAPVRPWVPESCADSTDRTITWQIEATNA